MDWNYVAIVFDTYAQASNALEQLRDMERTGDIAMQAAVVVRRDAAGKYEVENKHTFPALKTIAAASAAALIGRLVGGVAGMAAGAYAGGVAGMASDVAKSGERQEGIDEVEAGLRPNQAAIVTEVSEKEQEKLNTRMRELGGQVYRRTPDELRHNFFTQVDDEKPETSYFADPSVVIDTDR